MAYNSLKNITPPSWCPSNYWSRWLDIREKVYEFVGYDNIWPYPTIYTNIGFIWLEEYNGILVNGEQANRVRCRTDVVPWSSDDAEIWQVRQVPGEYGAAQKVWYKELEFSGTSWVVPPTNTILPHTNLYSTGYKAGFGVKPIALQANADGTGFSIVHYNSPSSPGVPYVGDSWQWEKHQRNYAFSEQRKFLTDVLGSIKIQSDYPHLTSSKRGCNIVSEDGSGATIDSTDWWSFKIADSQQSVDGIVKYGSGTTSTYVSSALNPELGLTWRLYWYDSGDESTSGVYLKYVGNDSNLYGTGPSSGSNVMKVRIKDGGKYRYHTSRTYRQKLAYITYMPSLSNVNTNGVGYYMEAYSRLY